MGGFGVPMGVSEGSIGVLRPPPWGSGGHHWGLGSPLGFWGSPLGFWGHHGGFGVFSLGF